MMSLECFIVETHIGLVFSYVVLTRSNSMSFIEVIIESEYFKYPLDLMT